MKPAVLSVPVHSLRRIETPFERDPGYRNYVAVVDARHLPDMAEWRDINVRDPKLRGRVPEAIREGFIGNPKEFLFMNRGLVIAADRVEFNEHGRDKVMALHMKDPRIHGLLDGGHTYKVVTEAVKGLADDDPQRFVRVEVITGFDREGIVEVVEARNTSNQVKDESLANLAEEFKQIKKVLGPKEYYASIAWKEYEEDPTTGRGKPIDVRDIVSFLITFDTAAYGSTKQPLIAYKDKRACLTHFLDHKKRMRKYYHLLPEILLLWDEIHDKWGEWYKRSRDAEAGIKGRPGGLVGMLPDAQQQLYFKGKVVKGRIPEAYKYPVLSALRAAVRNRGQGVRWATDPFELIASTGPSLVGVVGTAARSMLNPNRVGKDASTWANCYLIVESTIHGTVTMEKDKRIQELEAQLAAYTRKATAK